LISSGKSIGTTTETTLTTLESIFKKKQEEEFTENYDISLIDYISQESKTGYILMNEIVRKFKEFLQVNEEWINNKWMGRALKRLDLVIEKRRKSYGVEIILNIKKAQKKIRMFK
jgi:hypothetical protein